MPDKPQVIVVGAGNAALCAALAAQENGPDVDRHQFFPFLQLDIPKGFAFHLIETRIINKYINPAIVTDNISKCFL